MAPCGSSIGKSEFAIKLEGVWADLRIYDRNGVLGVPDPTYSAPNPGNGTVQLRAKSKGCDYFIGFEPSNGADGRDLHFYYGSEVQWPVTVEIERLTEPGPGHPSISLGISRFVYGSSRSGPAGAFFRPYANTGINEDVYFLIGDDGVHVSPDDFWLANNGAGLFMDDVIPDDGWVYPYHRNAICAAVPCGTPLLNVTSQAVTNPFLMPIDRVFVYGDTLTKHLTPAVSMVFLPGEPMNWTEDWLTLAFAPGTRLETKGTFDASGVKFKAADAALGWDGIFFEPGSSGTLAGVTVSGARWRFALPSRPQGLFPYPPGAAISVNNAAVTITGRSIITGDGPVETETMTLGGGTVFGTNGLRVTGTTANVTVTGRSLITQNDGLGIVATGGAHVLVDGEASVTVNGTGGIRALGDGTQVSVTGYAQVNDNYSVGVQADERAFVSVRSPSGLNNTSVSVNVGGPTARTAASIDGTQCVFLGATGRPNIFELNTDSGNSYDAAASGGAFIVARYAYWGVNAEGIGRSVGDLVLDVGPSGLISAAPTAALPSTPDPTCFAQGRASAGMTLRPSAGAAPAAGRASDAVIARAAAAREAAWAGDTDDAFAMLYAAAAATETDDDREAVFGATAALLSDAQPPAVVAALEAAAARATAATPWARRALAVAYAALGRTAEADAVAASLSGLHAATGHGLRVRLAVDAGGEALALAQLVAFAEDADAAGDVEALGSAMALVAGAFPAADLSVVPGSLAGGSAGRGTTGAAGTTADAPAAGSAAESRADLADGVDVYPNPAAERAAVRLSLAAAAEHATATVYDALGRRVAVLHDGPLGAGAHAFAFDAAQMPPGVYVVQVRVSRSGGAAWTEVRRVTIAH